MKTLRNIIIFIIIAALVGSVAYFVFFKDKTNTTSSGLQTTSVVNTNTGTVDTTKALSQQFLASLSKIKNITLATTFFDTSAYKSLQDYTQLIILQDPSLIGRPNPFAPFDIDTGVTLINSTVPDATLAPPVPVPANQTQPAVVPKTNKKK